MSFILDALKKIERDKRRATAGEPSESVAMSGTRFGGRRQWVSMAGVAFVSAAVTAAAVSLFNGRGGQGPREDATAHAAMEVDTPRPVVLPMEPGGRAAASPEPAGLEDRHSNEGAEAEPSEPEEPMSSPVGSGESEPRVEDPSREGEAVEPPEELPAAESFEETRSPESVSAEPVQPFHLVGRERALGDTVNVGRRSSDGAEVERIEKPGPPPAGFPDLVLQGTSVIDGHPVAVISGQRVFEEDRIEGARVVRIGEREVELELDGQRFTLRL